MDQESNDYIKRLIKNQQTLSQPRCAECRQLLTTEEIEEAKWENIKEPICNDCYSDFLQDTRPPYPDENNFYRRNNRGV
jgi:NAD-dependent SIR2 family protein deacetylase